MNGQEAVEDAVSSPDLKLDGSWRLADCRLTYADERVTRPLGNSAAGYLIYAPDGFVSESLNFATRDGTIVCLCVSGEFQVVEGRVFHYVSVSTDINLVGTVLERDVRIENGQLVLTASPAPSGGPGSRIEYFWDRADAATGRPGSTGRAPGRNRFASA